MLTFFQFLLFEDVSLTPDSDDATERKGWMSPKGVPHYFNANLHHAYNPHPALKKEIDRITHHAPPESKERSDEGKKAIAHSQHKGYARYGKKFDTNFVHYDNKAKGGTRAALAALKDLSPAYGERIVINHKPWGDSTTANDAEFKSPSKAAEHILKMHTNN